MTTTSSVSAGDGKHDSSGHEDAQERRDERWPDPAMWCWRRRASRRTGRIGLSGRILADVRAGIVAGLVIIVRRVDKPTNVSTPKVLCGSSPCSVAVVVTSSPIGVTKMSASLLGTRPVSKVPPALEII